MTWWAYVQHVTSGAPQITIAKKTDINGSTISRWRTSEPQPANVVTFAKAYGRPVLEAFVAAGFLSEEDAGAQLVITRHTDPSDDELLDLLRDRLARLRELMGNAQHPAPTTAAPDPGAPTRDQMVWDERAAALQSGPGRRLTDREVVDTIGPRPSGGRAGEVVAPLAGENTGHRHRGHRGA